MAYFPTIAWKTVSAYPTQSKILLNNAINQASGPTENWMLKTFLWNINSCLYKWSSISMARDRLSSSLRQGQVSPEPPHGRSFRGLVFPEADGLTDPRRRPTKVQRVHPPLHGVHRYWVFLEHSITRLSADWGLQLPPASHLASPTAASYGQLSPVMNCWGQRGQRAQRAGGRLSSVCDTRRGRLSPRGHRGNTRIKQAKIWHGLP